MLKEDEVSPTHEGVASEMEPRSLRRRRGRSHDCVFLGSPGRGLNIKVMAGVALSCGDVLVCVPDEETEAVGGHETADALAVEVRWESQCPSSPFSFARFEEPRPLLFFLVMTGAIVIVFSPSRACSARRSDFSDTQQWEASRSATAVQEAATYETSPINNNDQSCWWIRGRKRRRSARFWR
ncbi:hypothetical protein PG985_001829 [Apiospora marii]|uniref:Uncharacterized protein n=1 Tax=Apiospora marii TaxID=335849 RepID=A0ABR1RZN3_9PEZI